MPKPPSCGIEGIPKPPPPVLPRPALGAGVWPQPKSLCVAEEAPAGDLTEAVCGVATAGWSGVDHGSLEPQASAAESPEKLLCVGGADDWMTGA